MRLSDLSGQSDLNSTEIDHTFRSENSHLIQELGAIAYAISCFLFTDLASKYGGYSELKMELNKRVIRTVRVIFHVSYLANNET